MATFSKEDLRRIAELTALKLSDAELESFAAQLKTVLEYTQELSSCPVSGEVNSVRNVNVFRDDKAVLQDARLILENAPSTEETYFVVPAILE
jgi:aspartyl-tRNA(Asn)/glutamyl-tRNA(Gln) amidotransferase subunit C